MIIAIYECFCIVLLFVCLDIVDTVVVLYLYLVKLLLSLSAVFFFLLCDQFMVNKDEYISIISRAQTNFQTC